MKFKIYKVDMKICLSVFEVMEQYIQVGIGSLEAGGVLIGKENISNDNITIKYITEPYARDKRSYRRFIRKDKKHIDIFNEIYNSSNGTYRYFGEWHTHDEAVPNYSALDLKHWRKIVKKCSENIDFFHIIVGNKALRIWQSGKLLNTPCLIKTIYWKEVKDFL